MNKESITKYKDSRILFVWVTILAALSGFVFIYRSSIGVMFSYWNDYGTYSHGYLTILVSAYLVFVCVKLSKLEYSGPSIVSIGCLSATSVAWLFACLVNVNVLQMLCMPFFVYFTLTFFYGFKNYRTLLIPIFILLFTIPVWSLLLPYLQDIAVVATKMLLSFSNLEYQVVDNTVIFSIGIFEIEESCSGLRYLLVGMLLSIVYGFLNYQSYWSVLVMVLAAMIIMLIGNVIRILIVIGLGVVKGMDYPLVQDHENLGWVLFAFLLIPLFVIARYIQPNLWQKTLRQEDKNENVGIRISVVNLFILLIIYLLVISTAPLYAAYLKNNVTEVASFKLNGIMPLEGWSGPVLLSSRWVPSYSSYSENFVGQYSKDNKTIALNSLLYTKHNSNGELINVNNQLADKNEWELVDFSPHQVIFNRAQESSVVVNKVTIHSKKINDCFRVWYWFDVGGSTYTKRWKVKLKQAEMLFNGESGGAITSISISCDKGSDEVLNDFMLANFAQLKKLILW